MDNNDAIAQKLEAMVSAGLTESTAVHFFGQLTKEECERLMAVFRTDTTGVAAATREKIILILERLRDAK